LKTYITINWRWLRISRFVGALHSDTISTHIDKDNAAPVHTLKTYGWLEIQHHWSGTAPMH